MGLRAGVFLKERSFGLQWVGGRVALSSWIGIGLGIAWISAVFVLSFRLDRLRRDPANAALLPDAQIMRERISIPVVAWWAWTERHRAIGDARASRLVMICRGLNVLAVAAMIVDGWLRAQAH